tara:strand:- start:3033 stop:3368 length:336 start_codon:yes stop_codon:yes gene_type:complete
MNVWIILLIIIIAWVIGYIINQEFRIFGKEHFKNRQKISFSQYEKAMIALSKVLQGHVTKIKEIKRDGAFLHMTMMVFEYGTATSVEYKAIIKDSHVDKLERLDGSNINSF